MWKHCCFSLFCLVWGLPYSDLHILNIVPFLESFTHQYSAFHVLIFTSQFGGLENDHMWRLFTKHMFRANVLLQINGLEKECSFGISEKKEIFLIYVENILEQNFVQQCLESEQIDTKNVWLLVTSICIEQSMLEVFHKLNLHINSNVILVCLEAYGSIQLFELYKVAKSTPLIMNHIGNWTTSSNCLDLLTKKYIYYRRQNMYGYDLKAVAVLINNFYILTQRKNNKLKVSGGFFGDLFLILKELLNFSLEHVEGYSYGSVDKKDKNWTGIIGILQRQEADVSVSEVSLVSDRTHVIDFSLPVHHVGQRIYARLGTGDSTFKFFLKPFSYSCWAAVILVMFATVCLRKTMQTLLKKYGEDLHQSSWFTDIFIHFSLLLQQGTEDPQQSPLRLLQWTVAFCFLILHLAYGAMLTSTSTVNHEEMPFSSLREVLHKPWKLAIVKGSLSEKYFQIANLESHEGNKWGSHLSSQKISLVGDVVEGLRTVLEKPGFVFLCQEESCQHSLYLKFTSDEACQLGTEQHKYFLTPLSFGLQKNSPYKHLINFHILRIMQVGINKRLYMKWILRVQECFRRSYVAAGLLDVMPLFYFLSFGITLSVVILYVEIIIKKQGVMKNQQKCLLNQNVQLIRKYFNPKKFLAKKRNDDL